MSKHHHMHHDFHKDYHMVDPIDFDEEDHEEEKKKGPWMIIASILVILLVFTFLLPLERIGSRVESKKIDSNYMIELDNNKRIFFSSKVYEEVRDNYLNSKTEIKMCLLGNASQSNYFVTGYYLPRIISSQYDKVISESCNSKTLISLHSHPNFWCIFSAQDIRSYEQLKKSNPKAFIGLICDVDRFNFHGY